MDAPSIININKTLLLDCVCVCVCVGEGYDVRNVECFGLKSNHQTAAATTASASKVMIQKGKCALSKDLKRVFMKAYL